MYTLEDLDQAAIRALLSAAAYRLNEMENEGNDQSDGFETLRLAALVLENLND